MPARTAANRLSHAGQRSCSCAVDSHSEARERRSHRIADERSRCSGRSRRSAQLVSHSGNPSETLTNIVHLIQRRFGTDVCSVYLLEPDRANLVLAATIGLRPESVGRVRMRLTEGLVGLVAEQLRPQVVADATTHPRFKYFREAGEDPYRSFLGVPLDRSRRCCRACWSCRRSSRAPSAPTTCGC